MKLLSFQLYTVHFIEIEPELKYKKPYTVVFKYEFRAHVMLP